MARQKQWLAGVAPARTAAVYVWILATGWQCRHITNDHETSAANLASACRAVLDAAVVHARMRDDGRVCKCRVPCAASCSGGRGVGAAVGCSALRGLGAP